MKKIIINDSKNRRTIIKDWANDSLTILGDYAPSSITVFCVTNLFSGLVYRISLTRDSAFKCCKSYEQKLHAKDSIVVIERTLFV